MTRRGISLLEVVLSLALFGLSMAALGELVRGGLRSAEAARDESRAQLLGQSVLAELRAGSIPAQSVLQTAFPDDPDWVYSIEVIPTMQDGLLEARVLVERAEESSVTAPINFELVGWMIDPMLELEAEAAEAAEVEAKAAEAEEQANAPINNPTPPTPN